MLPFSLNVSNTAIWSAFQPKGKKEEEKENGERSEKKRRSKVERVKDGKMREKGEMGWEKENG
jgi:hypothetical protein